jgi:electron transport complex protein RnfG
MRVDKEQWQMVFALVLVAVIAAGLLATTDIFTREPIAQAQREALRKALQQVLPEHVNDSQADVITLGKDKQQVAIYPAKNTEKTVVGLAWEVIAPDGYSGTIKILVGVRPEGKVHAIRVTFHRETPGLGDGIVDDAQWLGAFVGKGLEDARWAVKKDGGEFDQFTGATITPRAVVNAVKRALEYYKANQKLILDAIAAQDVKPEPVAEAIEETSSKAAVEVAPKAESKPVPEVAPELSPEAAQKAAVKAVSESVAETVPEVSTGDVQKAVSKAVSESVAETVPAAAVKADPIAVEISPEKKTGDGGGQ